MPLGKEFIKDKIELVNSLGNLVKNSQVCYASGGKSTKFDYVNLDAILSEVKKNNNFAFTFELEVTDDEVKVACKLQHISGEEEVSKIFSSRIDQNKLRPQEVASRITYNKRYAVAAFLGIAADADTDGLIDQEPKKINVGSPSRRVAQTTQKQMQDSNVEPADADEVKQIYEQLAVVKKQYADNGIDIVPAIDMYNKKIGRNIFANKSCATYKELSGLLKHLYDYLSAEFATYRDEQAMTNQSQQ